MADFFGGCGGGGRGADPAQHAHGPAAGLGGFREADGAQIEPDFGAAEGRPAAEAVARRSAVVVRLRDHGVSGKRAVLSPSLSRHLLARRRKYPRNGFIDTRA